MRRLMIMAVSAALALGLFAAPALADGHEFDLTVNHRINGIPLENALGIDLGGRDLPVEVNLFDGEGTLLGSPVFSFGEKIELTLPAGEYYVIVELAEGPAAGLPVLTLGSAAAPVAIPGGVDVDVTAKRTGGVSLTDALEVTGIGLKVKIK